MRYYQFEFRPNKNEYYVFEMPKGLRKNANLAYVVDANEVKSDIKSIFFEHDPKKGGKAYSFSMDNSQGFMFETKNVQVAVGVDYDQFSEIRKMDELCDEMNTIFQTRNIKKSPQLKKIARKAMVSVALVGGIATGIVAINQRPNFNVPVPAQQFNESVTRRMESDNLDPENEDAREVVIEQMCDTHEERFYKENLDGVAIAINKIEQDYNTGKITSKEAKQQLSEINAYYKDLMEKYEEYRLEQNNNIVTK